MKIKIELNKSNNDYTQILEMILINGTNPYISNYTDDDQFKNDKTIILVDNDCSIQNALSANNINFEIV